MKRIRKILKILLVPIIIISLFLTFISIKNLDSIGIYSQKNHYVVNLAGYFRGILPSVYAEADVCTPPFFACRTGCCVAECHNTICEPGEYCNTCEADCGVCGTNSINLSCKNNKPKIILNYNICSTSGNQPMEWTFWSSGVQFDTSQYWVGGGSGCIDVVEWSSDVLQTKNTGEKIAPDPIHTYAWDVSIPNQHDSPIVSGVFTTPECSVIPSCSISCMEGELGSKVCTESSTGPTFKATITWPTGVPGQTRYMGVKNSAGVWVGSQANDCTNTMRTDIFDLPVQDTYTYEIWTASCYHNGNPICAGCGGDYIVGRGGPFSVLVCSGCYNTSNILNEPHTLTITNFGYYRTPNGENQTDPDLSIDACSCLKTSAYSNNTCCGDDTDDCGKIVGKSICKIDSGSASFIEPQENKGDIKFINCSNLEYLSEGEQWSQCNGILWKKNVLDHDYLCTKVGKESIAECCGNSACNSKSDGKRLEDGQKVIVGKPISESSPKISITPNPVIRGQTVLNMKITNADLNFDVSLYQKRDGVAINNGTVIGKTNDFGNLWLSTQNTSSLSAGNYETYVVINNKQSNTITWRVVESAGQFALFPQSIIKGQTTFTEKLTNSDFNSDILLYTSLDGAAFTSSGTVGKTDGVGTWSKIISDTSSIAPGGYLSYVVVNDKQSNILDWNTALTSEKPALIISPTLVTRGKTELKMTISKADPNSPIIFFTSYNNESFAGTAILQRTDAEGNWALVLSALDTSGFDVGFYKTYVTINGKKSNMTNWSIVEPRQSTQSGTTFYCRTDSKFVTDLDTVEGRTTCEKAGFVWTGTKCCSEADDPHEYYNDQDGTGGCWDKSFVPAGTFANGTDSSVLNYNGVFHGCVINMTNYNTNNDNLLNITDYHSGTQLITEHNYCELDPSKNYFCSYTEKWLLSQGINRTHLSIVPVSVNSTTQKGECCQDKKCWDGAKCIDNQKDKPFENLGNNTNATTAYRCIDGEWVAGSRKCTPDGSICAYCPKPTQCLVDPFAKTEAEQCIDSGKFVGDDYCNNGEWATRTNLLASTLLGLREQDFSLFCDSKENALNYLQYKTSSNEQAASVLNRLKINKVCVLKNTNDVLIGLNLNQNSSNMSSKDWSLFKLQNCNAAISFSDGNYHPCSSSNNVWFNKDLISVIYSGNQISIPPQGSDPLGAFNLLIKSAVEQIVKTIQLLIEAPPVDDSYLSSFTKLDRILLDVEQGKEITGAISGTQFKNIVAHYQSFDTDICKSIEDYNTAKGLGESGIECINDGNDYYLLAQGSTLLNFNPDLVWLDLTSKLRIK